MIKKRFLHVLVMFAVIAAGVIQPLNAGAQSSAVADIVLVFPFENTSEHKEYNWIGESFSDSLSSLLGKPGLIVVSPGERAVTYQRLRLPLTVLPSRATAIKIARELKASMIVIGTYSVTLSPAASNEKSVPAANKPGA